MKDVKKLTLAAVLTAVACGVIFAGGLIPTGRLAVAAVACLAITAVCIECGKLYGLLAYVASAVIVLLLAPSKPVACVYAVFFGLYPIVKAVAEGVKSRVWEHTIKVGFTTVAYWLLVLGARLFFEFEPKIEIVLPFWIACCVVAMIFDVALSQLISFYISRISRRR
ncbi:MAG: hypothetical protein IKM04_00585 [Clostridia bacterium]|nr:hypothetical protein [Clostridia bacterium]